MPLPVNLACSDIPRLTFHPGALPRKGNFTCNVPMEKRSKLGANLQENMIIDHIGNQMVFWSILQFDRTPRTSPTIHILVMFRQGIRAIKGLPSSFRKNH